MDQHTADAPAGTPDEHVAIWSYILALRCFLGLGRATVLLSSGAPGSAMRRLQAVGTPDAYMVFECRLTSMDVSMRLSQS